MRARDSKDIPRRIADLDGQDAYAVLGVPPDATPDEIKAAYRRELARAHPDLGGSDHRAQVVNCAFDVLTRHRDDYDDLRRSPGGPAGPDVLSVEPDADLLDDPLADPGRGWWAGRTVFRAAVALLLLLLVVVAFGRGTPAPNGPSGWTAGQVGETTGEVPGTEPSVGTEPSAAPASTAASWSVPATAVVVAASAPPSGGGHRCEVRGDGSLWCSGGNARGQLGDGTGQDAAVPVRVAGPPGARWTAVSVGGLSTCGLQEDHTLWCWGDNSRGQLGDGTDSARSVPVAVEPPSRWLVIDVDTHVCGVRIDHTLWCWGAGDAGELGDDSDVDEASPVRVGREAGWVSVSADPGRTCAERHDGSWQCWGTGPAPTPTG